MGQQMWCTLGVLAGAFQNQEIRQSLPSGDRLHKA